MLAIMLGERFTSCLFMQLLVSATTKFITINPVLKTF
jgi:hypothetical protein